MPTDVKGAVSVVVLSIATGLTYWSGSPIQPEYHRMVLIAAVFFVVAMWIFPEAGRKKDRAGR
jgi:hypothetical protein